MLPLIRRGIGIHHGGLLPILREVIEILFASGWLKILFATETFAMGLNMPAKTAIFTSLRKFDGETFRWISSGEYTQMAGRAGRRGMDTVGMTILIVNEKIPLNTVQRNQLPAFMTLARPLSPRLHYPLSRYDNGSFRDTRLRILSTVWHAASLNARREKLGSGHRSAHRTVTQTVPKQLQIPPSEEG